MLAAVSVCGCVIAPTHRVCQTGVADAEQPRQTPAYQLSFYAAPTVLSGVSPRMKTPGFWIARQSEPDRAVMTSEGIAAFNARVVGDQHLRDDIAAFAETYTGSKIKDSLSRQLAGFRHAGYFAASGAKADAAFFADIASAMNLSSIPQTITVRFGLVTENADHRALPTYAPLMAKAGDIDFDELQNSALDVGTPVAILHQTSDGAWFYAVSPSSSGWLDASRVALCSRGEIQTLQSKPSFAVVTAAKADIFENKTMSAYHGFARMGSVFYLMSPKSDEVYEVYLPVRVSDGSLILMSGYIPADQAHEGFLPYTKRTVINQAFKLLNTPYGWGGAQGEQDCSQFLQEVFATVGVGLPRNSSAQMQVGRALAEFSPEAIDEVKTKRVATVGIGGTTLLYMKGHIMLYLGVVDGRPFAIHDTWAYREPGKDGDVPRVINRVVVSDLSLGAGSKKGSLVGRLKTVRSVE